MTCLVVNGFSRLITNLVVGLSVSLGFFIVNSTIKNGDLLISVELAGRMLL